MTTRLLGALLVAATLSGCGGMNRAVGVLPNTLDNLQRDTAPLRGAEQPGDRALRDANRPL
ncbi:hypothetical protein [Aureimonas jatrophae]|jgi:hypothetical protein|uniref:Uncharacterized protein n=1 Tax=Aureimonas jatrophae TaxID=1166073 RepID=A0A1H0K9R3_9HYPH|nr:hypothetical protein [Aureimonas jatrophae]MBB3951008.1 hypothetical protein [Aureimonas jatrophae]SDO52470.1 hypothetical protein SAMN05192530_107156 [Aureimonas jatrophae]